MKRFVSTEKWSDPWYRRLTPPRKCFWEWICAMCDAAGSLEIDYELASFQVGVEVSAEDLAAFGERIVCLPSGRHWITGFIDFQYGKLSHECKAHGPVFRAIEDRCIPYQVPYTVGYKVPSKTGQGQDKDSLDVSYAVSENRSGEPRPIPERPARVDAMWAAACPCLAEIRKAYPKTVAVFKANEEWARLVSAGINPVETMPTILAAIEWQSKTLRWIRDNGKFVPDLWRYLAEGQWQSEHTDAWDA